jgi:hypothetical protein
VVHQGVAGVATGTGSPTSGRSFPVPYCGTLRNDCQDWMNV